jgi:DTW domain-containing protein YfiP
MSADATAAAASPAAARCLTCRRPAALCWCRDLTPVPTRTHVVILQHPRERAMRMNTARLAHQGLDGAELHVGVRFDDHERLRELAREPHGAVALLYPHAEGTSASDLDAPPRTLVVVDGTWTTARKMLARSPLLRALPRVSLRPAAPSTYRIRREPAAHCLSTVEAVVAALTILEGDGARFAPLLAAFDRLVVTQLEHARRHPAPFRHERKHRRPRLPSAVETALASAERVVVVQAEGNPRDGAPHELVHLVALRPASGARFAVVVRPHSAVAERTPARLGLGADELAAGVDPAALAAAWSAFVRAGDVLVGWGCFTPALLATAGLPCPSWIDLRGEVARQVGRGSSGADAACSDLDAPPGPVWAPGRAGHRVATLARLVAALGGSQSRRATVAG